MSIYYVYAYLREDQTPYYIGKGKGYRAWANEHNVSLPKNRHNIIILERNLEEQSALDLEANLIKHYGRKDLGTGILYNKTDGGRSPVLYGAQNGMTGKHHTSETLELIRKCKLGKPRTNNKRIECKCCNNTYSPQGLLHHNPTQAETYRIYQCSHCNNKYTNKNSLRTHVKHTHIKTPL